MGVGSGPDRRFSDHFGADELGSQHRGSLLEVWWRSLRHHWLYLNTLDTAATVRRLVAFYIQQHNEVLPHSALNGRTPDEGYSGQAENTPAQLAAARKVARDERLAANRALSCEACTASGNSAAALVSAA